MKKFVIYLLLFTSLLCGCGSDVKLSMLVPSGSPLLSVAGVLESVDYEVTIGPDLLPVTLTKGEKDLVIAPIIVGAKLYNSGVSDYQLAAMVGWGNLHILSRTPISSIQDLEGKNILAFGEHSTPGIMLKLATADLNVTITFFKAVSDVGAPFLTKQYDYVLLSEPILSKIIASSSEDCFTFSLQNLAQLPKIAQFGIFVNPKANAQKVTAFLSAVEANVSYLNEEPLAYANSIVDQDVQFSELGIEIISNSIPNTELSYVSAQNAKTDVNEFLSFLINTDVNLIGAQLVDENFYAND